MSLVAYRAKPIDSELSRRVTHVTGVDAWEMIQNESTLAVEYATKKAAVEYMEDQKKITLAQAHEDARLESERRGEKTTESKLDNLARISRSYKQACEDLRNARVELASVEANYYAARHAREAGIELIRYGRSEQYNRE